MVAVRIDRWNLENLFRPGPARPGPARPGRPGPDGDRRTDAAVHGPPGSEIGTGGFDHGDAARLWNFALRRGLQTCRMLDR